MLTRKNAQIHDGVHTQVQGKTPTAPGLPLGVGDCGVEEGECVVVPVEEDDRPLAQNLTGNTTNEANAIWAMPWTQTRKRVSPSSGALLITNIQPQKPVTGSV